MVFCPDSIYVIYIFLSHYTYRVMRFGCLRPVGDLFNYDAPDESVLEENDEVRVHPNHAAQEVQ
jgi:hypothetical protein